MSYNFFIYFFMTRNTSTIGPLRIPTQMSYNVKKKKRSDEKPAIVYANAFKNKGSHF